MILYSDLCFFDFLLFFSLLRLCFESFLCFLSLSDESLVSAFRLLSLSANKTTDFETNFPLNRQLLPVQSSENYDIASS